MCVPLKKTFNNVIFSILILGRRKPYPSQINGHHNIYNSSSKLTSTTPHATSSADQQTPSTITATPPADARYNNTYDSSNRSNYYSRNNGDKYSTHNSYGNTSYRRRPFSSQNPTSATSSKYYGSNNNKSSPSWRSYRAAADTFDNKENSTTKPLFNEGKITRINKNTILIF